MRKKRIALLGLWDDKNYGDPILGYCARKMIIKSIEKRDSFVFFDVSISPNLQRPFFRRVIDSFLYRLARIRGNVADVQDNIYERCISTQFSRILNDVDYIIFVGGGVIKFKVQILDYVVEEVVKIAQRNGSPILMNAVGVEGFDCCDKRCVKLKESLNSPILKYISTRDDFQTLKHKYLERNNNTLCELVSDPAVWASECYNVQKNLFSDVIGINVARGEIFYDYGRDFSSEAMVDFYVQLVRIVLCSGYKVELFTNGLDQDNVFLERVVQKLNDCVLKKRIPSSARELVEIIASYKAVVATRMHAGIIAYSLDVPAVGLVWNEKIKFFWERAGHPQNCVELKDLTAEFVFLTLTKALQNGYDHEKRNVFRELSKNSVRRMTAMLV